MMMFFFLSSSKPLQWATSSHQL